MHTVILFILPEISSSSTVGTETNLSLEHKLRVESAKYKWNTLGWQCYYPRSSTVKV